MIKMKLDIHVFCKLLSFVEEINEIKVMPQNVEEIFDDILEKIIEHNVLIKEYNILLSDPRRIWGCRVNNWHWKLMFFEKSNAKKTLLEKIS